MSRIVEAILGHRRCDCKCNKVQQPVIINNNIYGQQPSSSSSGSAAVGVSALADVSAPVGVSALADVAGASIPLPPAVPVATAPQTQVYPLTSNQNYLNLIQALSHQRL